MTLTSSVSGVAEGRTAEAEETEDRKCRQPSPLALLGRAGEKWQGGAKVAHWKSGTGSFPRWEKCVCAEGK